MATAYILISVYESSRPTEHGLSEYKYYYSEPSNQMTKQ